LIIYDSFSVVTRRQAREIIKKNAPFDSPNREGSKYAILDNVWIDLLSKKNKKPIHIPTIEKSEFCALNS
jgi:hypothetical protein